MFSPNQFKQVDSAILRQAICENPLGSLITSSDSGMEADHIPFVLQQSDAGDRLIGHIAKANELWKKVADGAEVLVLFHGPNCYVSPSYYPSKKAHGRAVPTWNYVVVHAAGVIRFSHDIKWNQQALAKLTNAHESSKKAPWSLEDAPADYLARMLKGIVGIEIKINKLTGSWKLSQNQPLENQEGVIAGLESEEHFAADQVAGLVRKNLTAPN